jgi:hypothetical protein
MRKSVIILAVLGLLLCALAWFIRPVTEPRYQNGRVSFWIDYPGYTPSAMGFFPKADSNAIPYLVRGLRRKTTALQRARDIFYNVVPAPLKKHFRAPRAFNEVMVRASAAIVLGRIGTNSPPAIDGLIRVVKQEQSPMVKVYAIESLQKIGNGNAAVEKTIILAIQDPAPEVRDAAEDALRQLDPTAAKSLIR